ncbi:NshR/TsnR family 23S rRNA methyltransferase [Rothia nasimurium]|uniref:NshR/TsnR family 23S rRNA methyltransferase n=1 Tax=Rothia nasimurium TaxID=85336 RepID=A0A1Y1RNR0_9MICC|nr:TrmH family RNA methyltransferase [Rothia nasimurium]ORC16496.1 NshR/TsnR family 23S rRNA methyltransferase [Rothia nasimurium]
MLSPDFISERSDPAVQRIVDLIKPARGKLRTVLIEDFEPLMQSLAAGVEFVEIYGLENATLPHELLTKAAEHNIPVRVIATSLAGQIFKIEKKPKLFGVARVPRPSRLTDLEKASGDIILLDGVKIVGNIGAIVRTSFALGAAGIVLVNSDLASVADRRLIRASRGYVFSLPVVLATREEALKHFSKNSSRLVSFDLEGSVSIEQLGHIKERLVLVFGSEKIGASEAIGAISQDKVTIPMNPRAESLNVSVSAGIALHSRADFNLASTAPN